MIGLRSLCEVSMIIFLLRRCLSRMLKSVDIAGINGMPIGSVLMIMMGRTASVCLRESNFKHIVQSNG